MRVEGRKKEWRRFLNRVSRRGHSPTERAGMTDTFKKDYERHSWGHAKLGVLEAQPTWKCLEGTENVRC